MRQPGNAPVKLLPAKLLHVQREIMLWNKPVNFAGSLSFPSCARVMTTRLFE